MCDNNFENASNYLFSNLDELRDNRQSFKASLVEGILTDKKRIVTINLQLADVLINGKRMVPCPPDVSSHSM